MGQFDISFDTMNRVAVVILPKQPFVDWLNSIPADFKVNGKQCTLLDIRDQTTVYLIPDFDHTPEMEDFFFKT